jgi:hypothetical protein
MTNSSHGFELQWELEVLEQIRGLPRELQLPVVRRCGELCENPRPLDFEKLEVSYRISFEGVLIWYWTNDANRIVIIVRVALDPGAGHVKRV